MLHPSIIIESVDSISREGLDVTYKYNTLQKRKYLENGTFGLVVTVYGRLKG